METSSKMPLWIALGLVAAFVLGGLTATTGIAVTSMAKQVLFGGGEFVHGGYPPAGETWVARGECEMMRGPFDGGGHGMRGHGMGFEWDEKLESPPMMPGSRGQSEGFHSEGFDESCPMWGNF